MSSLVLRGRKVVGGCVEGEALVTHQTISGWGGVNPMTGTVVETRHELRGVSFKDKVLVFPGAKGSSGWSAVFHFARLAGTATGVANMGSMTGAMLLQPLIGMLLDLGWTGETNYLNARAYGAQAWRDAFLLLLGWLAASLACALATRETHARQVR